jgi:hypothetical protein
LLTQPSFGQCLCRGYFSQAKYVNDFPDPGWDQKCAHDGYPVATMIEMVAPPSTAAQAMMIYTLEPMDPLSTAPQNKCPLPQEVISACSPPKAFWDKLSRA